MKYLCKTALAAVMVLTWTACSSESRPEPADCLLEAGSVVYQDGELGLDVTATVIDDKGNPVEDVLIVLQSDRTGDGVEPAIATTDADGQATFMVWTQEEGNASLQASQMDASEVLGQPVEVEFRLQLLLIADPPELTSPGAEVSLSAQVSDDLGAVEGASLTVTSDRGSADTIEPASQTSSAAGTASFLVSTLQAGSATFTLQVDELVLSDPPDVEVIFMGPDLSGQWSFPQPGGEVLAPRIGLMWIDFGQEGLPGTELTSLGIEPVPVWGESGSYRLELPLQAPREDLYHPDETDPDLPASFRIAPYLMFGYDDLDDSGNFSGTDLLLSKVYIKSLTMLVYVEGELPDPSVVPGVAPGYQFMHMIPGQETPAIVPWDQQTDEADLEIRAAKCTSGPMTGQITFGGGLDPASDTRLSVIMIDANLLLGGAGDQVFNDGNFVELASKGVDYTSGSSQSYELELPDPAAIDPAYGRLLVSMGAEIPEFGILAPLVFVDFDGDGYFTNPDNNPDPPGDWVIGMVVLPFGYGQPMLQWIDGPANAMLATYLPGVNQGYNLVHEPLRKDVEAVVDDNTLQLTSEIEPGHSGLPFKIVRQVDDQDQMVMEGDDLATGANPGQLVTSEAGGFSALVLAGDELIITSQLEEVQILDLDTFQNLWTL